MEEVTGGAPSELDRKLRVGRDRSQVILLPALVAQSQLILVVGGQGDPHESTKPRRTGAREDANGNAEFLCGGVRASESVRAQSVRELACVPRFSEAL